MAIFSNPLFATYSVYARNTSIDDDDDDGGGGGVGVTLQVGTEFVRGVSGGERKRTNIAMELITSPRVLFLDEPTTGLDANTAYQVMHILQRQVLNCCCSGKR